MTTTMTRRAALGALLEPVPAHETVVFANGFLSREGWALRPGAPDFPMIGSMGLAPSIALGLAVQAPGRPVMVVDGDGNLLMGMSALPAIGALGEEISLIHAVLDDASYASTGSQPTISARVDFPAQALACGYASAWAPTTEEGITSTVRRCRELPGAHLIHIRMQTKGQPPAARVEATPLEITARVRAGYGSAAEPRPQGPGD
jgi:thiamine pyrophosphate-dependent acetolactate synthase large subunit-like protein